MKCDKQECCHRGKKYHCYKTFFFLCPEFVRRWSDEDVLVLQETPVRDSRRDSTNPLPCPEQQKRLCPNETTPCRASERKEK